MDPKPRPRWGRRILISLGVIILVFVMPFVIFLAWAKAELWNEVASQARPYGVELNKPDIQIRWWGGWRFQVKIENLKGDLRPPFAAQGTFQLPYLETNFELFENFKKVRIEDFKVTGLSFDLEMQPEAKAQEPTPPSEEFEIPALELPSFERPELPLEVEVLSLDLNLSPSSFKLLGENQVKTQFQSMHAAGKAHFAPKLSELELNTSLKDLNLSFESPTQKAQLNDLNLEAKILTKGTKDKPLLLTPNVDVILLWSKLAFQKPKPQPLEIQDRGGKFQIQLSPEKLSLSAQGNALSSSLLNRPSDWSLKLDPELGKGRDRNLKLHLDLPGLLHLDTRIQVPQNLDPKHPAGKVQGNLSFHSDLSLLALKENPFPWREMIGGPFKAELRSAGDLHLETKLGGKDFSFQTQAILNPKSQEAEASGFFSIDFRRRDLSLKDIRPTGRISAPYKFLARQKRQIFFETELRFHDFSLSTPDLKITSLQGNIPLKQSWLYQNQGWFLSPRLRPNAFARADFESFEPLESRLNVIRIQKLEWQKKTYGPITLDLRFEQNLLRSGNWSAQVADGILEGSLQADLTLDHPRLGLLMRAFEVRLQDLLPTTILQSQIQNAKGLSFRLGMDWDIANATAVGQLDWSSITSEQVLQILDVLDPKFENSTFNQARMLLGSAYPTRVQVNLRGSVADVRLKTNVMDLPEVRNLAISPYLIKANEALYASPLYQELRGREAAVPLPPRPPAPEEP